MAAGVTKMRRALLKLTSPGRGRQRCPFSFWQAGNSAVRGGTRQFCCGPTTASLPSTALLLLGQAPFGAFLAYRVCSSSGRRTRGSAPEGPASPMAPAPTCCAIPSPPTPCAPGPISGRCRSCWATPGSPRPSATPISRSRTCRLRWPICRRIASALPPSRRSMATGRSSGVSPATR